MNSGRNSDAPQHTEHRNSIRALVFGTIGLTLSVAVCALGTSTPGNPLVSVIAQQALWTTTAFAVAVSILLAAVAVLAHVLARYQRTTTRSRQHDRPGASSIKPKGDSPL